MKFVPYTKYRPSPARWISQVPQHWDVLHLRRRLVAIKDGTHGSFERVSDGIPLLSAKNVNSGRITIGEDESMISNEDCVSVTRNGFPQRGDVLLTIVGTVGRAAVFALDRPLPFQRSVAFLRFHKNTIPEFMRFVFESVLFQTQLKSFTNAAAQGGAYMGDVAGIPVAFPPLSEQEAVVRFLSSGCADLDALIRKKEDLVRCFREKRSVLISRTVTRGLPPEAARAAGFEPNPKMKPSGIEWVEDIPKHWRMLPFKRLCSRVDVGIAEAATHAYCDDGVPIIRSTNVRPNTLDANEILHIEPWFAEKNRSKTLQAGDLVTVRTGYPGTTAVIPQEYAGSQCFTLVVSSLKRTEIPKFFSYFFNADPGATYFQMEGWGTAQINISVPIVQHMPVLRPPSAEQLAIVAFLDRETAKIDALMAKVEQAIERLREYRTALITAAVTGKIDVRGDQSGLGGLDGLDGPDGQDGPDGHGAKAASRAAQTGAHG